MMLGTPPPAGGAITVKDMVFETREAFATETLIVPEAETSLDGIATVKASHLPPPASWQVTTEEGESASPPKCTTEVLIKPDPVSVSAKFPLPAATLVGEIEAIVGMVFENETVLPPPHPTKRITIPVRVPRRTRFRLMFTTHRAWLVGRSSRRFTR